MTTPYTLFFADYEDGTENSGNKLIGHNADMLYSVQNVGLGRSSARGIKHELRQDDDMQAGGMRAESHSIHVPETHFGHGLTRYYGFSIYVPSTWETDTAEDIVFQWMNWPDPDEDQKWPSAFLSVQPNGTWRLRVNSDAGATTEFSASLVKTAHSLGAISPGQWHDFVFKFKWSYDATGHIDAWRQYQKAPGWVRVLAIDGANTYNDDGLRGYLKWGVYKPAWNYGNTTAITSRSIFHDNIAVGTTALSVVPGYDHPCV